MIRIMPQQPPDDDLTACPTPTAILWIRVDYCHQTFGGLISKAHTNLWSQNDLPQTTGTLFRRDSKTQ